MVEQMQGISIGEARRLGRPGVRNSTASPRVARTPQSDGGAVWAHVGRLPAGGTATGGFSAGGSATGPLLGRRRRFGTLPGRRTDVGPFFDEQPDIGQQSAETGAESVEKPPNVPSWGACGAKVLRRRVPRHAPAAAILGHHMRRRPQDTMKRATSVAMSARAQTMVLTVATDAGPIAVTVTRKRVKNLNLRVRGDGSVVASVPLHTSTARAQAFLDRRADWIAAHVLRRHELAELGGAVAGKVPSTYPLWGELIATRELLGADGADTLAPEAVDELIAARYRLEVEQALPAVAAALEARMGVHASRWQVRSMKTRWGSCTPRTRAIRINARLAAYPPACLGFVVAHELCHLMEPSHNQRFHTLLDIYCPENRACAALLRQPARTVARA